MTTTIISWDLLQDIISYMPLDTLSDLDKASPEFTREIFSTGIRVFHENDRYTLLDEDDLVISFSGKKELLTHDSDRQYIRRSGKKVNIYNIKWTTDEKNELYLFESTDIKCTIVYIKNGQFLITIKTNDNPERLCQFDDMVLTKGIPDDYQFIDMNTKLMCTITIDVTYWDDFEVLFPRK